MVSAITPYLLLLCFSASVSLVHSFVIARPIIGYEGPTSTSLDMISPDLADAAITTTSHFLSLVYKEIDADTAKAHFFFLFGAGSGAGGIGLAQVPRIVKELQLIRQLSSEGPTQGGETLSTNPLVSLLYPKQLSLKDVQKVISKIPSAAKINAQGTSTSFFASKGYVVQEDFLVALQRASCNPLASYAAFQAVSKGSGKCVSPDDVDTSVEAYKTDEQLQLFTKDFETSVFTKLSSYVALAFLLLVTFDLIVETGIAAFL